MTTVNLSQSTDFKINEITIKSKYGTIDVRTMMKEINIFDSVLQPSMSGNIFLEDAVGLSSKLVFDGSQTITIDISKDDNFLNFKKTFQIYKQSDRKINTLTSETYILHFTSEEFLYSEQQTSLTNYTDTYANIVKKTLKDALKIPTSKVGVIEDSQGLRLVNPPQLKPIPLILWCSKRALDSNGSPNFLFFENNKGYHFVSVSKLFAQKPIFDVDFSVKNLGIDSAKSSLLGVRGYEVISQYDFINNTRAGVYSGTFVGFDPQTRTYIKKRISFNDIYGGTNHANKNGNPTDFTNRDGKKATEMYESRRIVFPFAMNRASNDYIKSTDPNSITLEESPEKWYFQRQAILQNLFAQRVKLSLPGNFALSSGYNLNMMIPNRSETAQGEDNVDYSLYGRYLIIGTRHMIRYDMHETIVEVVTDSTNQPVAPSTVSGNGLTFNSVG